MRKSNVYAWMAFISTEVLLLLLFGFLGIWVLYGSAANMVNQAGFQRTRGERIAKDALILQYHSSPLERTQAISEMQDTLPLWMQTEKGLQYGDASLGLPRHPPPQVLLSLIQAQSDYLPMQIAAQKILANTGHIDPSQTQIILDHEHGYAVTANLVVLAWQQDIDDIFYQLFWIESGLVGAIFLIVSINFYFSVLRKRGN